MKKRWLFLIAVMLVLLLQFILDHTQTEVSIVIFVLLYPGILVQSVVKCGFGHWLGVIVNSLFYFYYLAFLNFLYKAWKRELPKKI